MGWNYRNGSELSATLMKLRVMVVAAATALAALADPPPGVAYDDDGHFYTTTLLQYSRAKNHKLSNQNGALLAYCAQLPDLSKELDAVTLRAGVLPSVTGSLWGAFSTCWGADVRRMVTIHHYLHALTGEKDQSGRALQPQRVTDAAVATLTQLYKAVDSPTADPNDVCAAGLAIHLLGDSFSHRQRDDPSRMYEAGFGHFSHGADPDRILYKSKGKDRTALWFEYVRTLNETLALGLTPTQVDELKKLVDNNLRDSVPRSYNEEKMRDGLREIFRRTGPPPVYDWAPYNPRVEELTAKDRWLNQHVLQWSCSDASDASHDLFKHYPPPRTPLSCPLVWEKYKTTAIREFKARGIAAPCDE